MREQVMQEREEHSRFPYGQTIEAEQGGAPTGWASGLVLVSQMN